MTKRSQRKCQWSKGDLGRATTVSESQSLSRTSIFALTPLLLRAIIRRLAATAAPPVLSLVFTIKTLTAAANYSLFTLHFSLLFLGLLLAALLLLTGLLFKTLLFLASFLFLTLLLLFKFLLALALFLL